MTLSEFSCKIDRLAAKYPDAIVVAASDEEGNSFNEIDVEPWVGYFDEDCNFSTKKSEVNKPAKRAICVN